MVEARAVDLGAAPGGHAGLAEALDVVEVASRGRVVALATDGVGRGPVGHGVAWILPELLGEDREALVEVRVSEVRLAEMLAPPAWAARG